MNKTLRNIKNIGTIALAMFAGSTLYAQNNNKFKDYKSVSGDELIGLQLSYDNIKKPTKDDSIRVEKELTQSLFELANCEDTYHIRLEDVLTKTNNNNYDVTILTGAATSTSGNIQNLPQDTPFAIRAMLAGYFGASKDQQEKIVELLQEKKAWLSGLDIFGGVTFNKLENPDNAVAQNGGYLGLSIPIYKGLSARLQANLGSIVDSQTSQRAVLDSARSPSGRDFVLAQYTTNKASEKDLFGAGLEYQFGQKWAHPITLFAGVVGSDKSTSNYVENREEVYFNGELIGEGNLPEELVTSNTNQGFNFTPYVGGAVTIGKGLELEASTAFKDNQQYNIGLRVNPSSFFKRD